MDVTYTSYEDMDRDSLETLCLELVDAYHYYDLADIVCELSNEELLEIIESY